MIPTIEQIAAKEATIGAVKLQERGSCLLVHRCVNEPGWQITRFGDDGAPWGHTVEHSLTAALLSASGVFGQWPPYGHGEIIEITTMGGESF